MILKTSSKCFGLIGGLGPAAAVHYYTQILAAYSGSGTTPRIVMSHAEADFVRDCCGRGDAESLAAYLAEHIRILAKAGADFAAIPAVAPHLCAPQLAKQSPIPLLDIIDAGRAELKRRNLRRIGMMGTRWVMDSRFYGRLSGVDLVPLPEDEAEEVHAIYLAIVASGRAPPADVARLREIARAAIARDDLQAIALAGTDLAVAFDEASAGFPAVDCARVHIDAIVEAMTQDYVT